MQIPLFSAVDEWVSSRCIFVSDLFFVYFCQIFSWSYFRFLLFIFPCNNHVTLVSNVSNHVEQNLRF